MSIRFPLSTPAVISDEVESKIRLFVESMNATCWVQSQYSCEGHPNDHGIVNLPYVDFYMNETCAKAIDLALNQWHSDGRTIYLWNIYGIFIMPKGLRRVLAWRVIPDIGGGKRWSRKKMDFDLRLLAERLPDIVNRAGQSNSISFLGFED